MPQKPSQTLTVRFPSAMRQHIKEGAKRRSIKDGALVKLAVEEFFNNTVHSPAPDALDEARKKVAGFAKDPAEVITKAPTEAVAKEADEIAKLSEPTLANTEEGFRLGVEAACEKVSKNVRLGVKMATGISMGEDIAKRIRLDLLGG